MRKLKILLLGMSKHLGGIETYYYNLVKNKKEDFLIDIVFIGQDAMPFEEELKSLGCNIYRICSRRKNRKKHIQELIKIFENEYDIIHYSIMNYSWFEPIVNANKYSNSKIIVHSHNAGFKNDVTLKTKLLHKYGKFRTKSIPIIRVACGQDAGNFMFDKKEFTIFNNGVNIEEFLFNDINRKKIRNNLGCSNEEIVIGLVARLEEQKNPLFLVDVFFEYNKLNNLSRLIIVGDGSYKKKIINKVKKYNIEEKVNLLGTQNNVNEILSAMDIFLMPSLYEGLSIALIEAQVNGLKCYTSVNVDKKSNISGNVEFLDLDQGPQYWARHIFKNINLRDGNVKNKIPNEFYDVTSYDKVYNFYKDIVNK